MSFSISEVLLVLMVALLVVKPEQLPDVAHSLGRFTKTIRGMFGKVKEEVNGFIDAVDKPLSDKRDQK